MKRVVVVGGGIAGLTVVHRLWELSSDRNIPLEIMLFEAQSRLGGVIRTHREKGFLLEAGPDAFLTEKPWALDLCRRLGLEEELVGILPQAMRSFLIHRNRLVPVPEGIYLMVPTRWKTLATFPWLSVKGKIRAALERFVPPARLDGDESIAQFVRRRFGKEVLDRIARPMIGGIYGGDLDRLSLKATLPRFHEWEQRWGSVIRGIQASVKADDRWNEASGPRYALFASLHLGMEELVRALVARLAGRVHIRNDAEVCSLRWQDGRWEVVLRGGETLNTDTICLAIPAYGAAQLIQPLDPQMAQWLNGIRYETAITVHLAFPQTALAHPIEGAGFVVGSSALTPMIGCSFPWQKFPDRAPCGSILVRAFFSSAREPHVDGMDDEDLVREVRRVLKILLGIEAAPSFAMVHRLRQAMPQYEVGHGERLKTIRRRLSHWPTLFLTGAAFGGIGIPDTIHHAEETAEEIVRRCST
jgi:oxygen-dependent protoporphyrinogen oxidase